MVVKPYEQTNINQNVFERIFREHTDENELVWHRDRKDRSITVIESSGWKFQQDNKLPVEMKPGDTFKIKAKEYHRIHKGTGSLVVRIQEFD